jgi:hypothetical protein
METMRSRRLNPGVLGRRRATGLRGCTLIRTLRPVKGSPSADRGANTPTPELSLTIAYREGDPDATLISPGSV